MKQKIGIIGGGNMGAAIIAGIKKKYNVLVCEQDAHRRSALKKKFRIRVVDLNTLIKESKIVILAVKPQNFDELLNSLKGSVKQNQLVISIAAGITTQFIERGLSGKVKVVRTMPNLPAQIGLGVTGISKGKYAGKQDLAKAKRIFNLIGETVVVGEKSLDAVTAVSGSGPAYLFYFIECLENAAKQVGLKEKEAQTLILHTLKGSLTLFEESNEKAGVLRTRVTSKGGTTQAALKILNKQKFNKAVVDAIKAASKRSKQLSK